MRKILIFLILAVSFIANNSFAQKTYVGINLGTTSLQGSDGYSSDISSGGAGFSTEYHIGMLVKLQVPIAPLTPVLSVTYTSLKGSDNGTETSQGIYSLGLGGQFSISAGMFSPYFALDLSYNFFGKYDIKNAPAGYTTSNEANGPTALSSQSRLGGGIGMGVDINLIQGIDIDLSGRIMVLNLIGKKNSEDNLNSLTFNASILF